MAALAEFNRWVKNFCPTFQYVVEKIKSNSLISDHQALLHAVNNHDMIAVKSIIEDLKPNISKCYHPYTRGGNVSINKYILANCFNTKFGKEPDKTYILFNLINKAVENKATELLKKYPE